MQVIEKGSVRVDLLGGTLDLLPINLIIPNVVTINCATNLKAVVKISSLDFDGVEIRSKDYQSTHRFQSSDFCEQNFLGNHFGPLNFVCQILSFFKATKNILVELESGSPAGAGLGGSSAMGVTLAKAILKYGKKDLPAEDIIKVVQGIESRILNAGVAGYQDYYPALYGGILALIPSLSEIQVEQAYSSDLAEVIGSSCTLFYSGQTRNSGINNWEVYKAFFDKNKEVIEGLNEIANLSYLGLEAIRNKKYSDFLNLIKQEGLQRTKLFSGIVTSEVQQLFKELQLDCPDLGLKACGAGGGGCYLLIHGPEKAESIRSKLKQRKVEMLNLHICPPV